jgi:hypothetical protein
MEEVEVDTISSGHSRASLGRHTQHVSKAQINHLEGPSAISITRQRTEVEVCSSQGEVEEP